MPRKGNGKISSGALPYRASKPKPKPTVKAAAIKKPTKKSTKGKSKKTAAAVAEAAEAAAEAARQKQIDLENAILESEFVAPEAQLPRSALGNLSNPILPIFRAANFPDVDDYALIEPSVRLASLLLKHPSLRPMLRTILEHGDFISTGERDNDKKMQYRYPENSRSICQSDVALIDTSLDDLAEFVTFRTNVKHSRTSGDTKVVKKKIKRKFRTPVLQGHRSRVEFSPLMLETLAEASKPAGKKVPDLPFPLAYRFIFAVLLAHEVCHALTFAKDGHNDELDTDPFFHGDLTAEVGYAMEETLFGGSPAMIWHHEEANNEEENSEEANSEEANSEEENSEEANSEEANNEEANNEEANDEEANSDDAMRAHRRTKTITSDLVGLLVVWPWPCTHTIREYHANNRGLGMLKADRDALAPKDIAWRVSLKGLARFFKAEFWAQENPPTLLERKVGIAFSCDDKGKKVPAEVSKEELKRYAPGGYRVSKNKAIVKSKAARASKKKANVKRKALRGKSAKLA